MSNDSPSVEDAVAQVTPRRLTPTPAAVLPAGLDKRVQHMAQEIILWGRCGRVVPQGYVRVEPGDAMVTRHIKRYAEVVYIQKRQDHRGYTTTVGYYAPEAIVAEARRWAAEHRRQSALREAVRRRRDLLGAAAGLSSTIFLALEPQALAQVLSEYRRAYGEKKAEYVRRVYNAWRQGAVAMSPALQERLLAFLPPLLSFDQKFRIVEALWNGTRPSSSLDLALGPALGIDAAVALAQQRLGEARTGGLPLAVTDVIAWLSQKDAQQTLELVLRLGQQEDRLVAERLQAELMQLQGFVARIGPGGEATKVVEMPGVRITVRMWGHRGGDATASDQPSRDLVPADSGPPAPRPEMLVRIQNPGDLLGEGLRQLPPDEAAEILETAAKKALDHQVRRKTAELDQEIIGRRLGQVVETTRHLDETGGSYVINAEERTEGGYTSVKVGSDPFRSAHAAIPVVVVSACLSRWFQRPAL